MDKKEDSELEDREGEGFGEFDQQVKDSDNENANHDQAEIAS